MAALTSEFAVLSSDSRRRATLMSGAFGEAVASISSVSKRILPGQSLTIEAASKLYIRANSTLDGAFQYGNPLSSAIAIKVFGFIALPGPCKLVLTNNVSSTDVDGGIDVMAVYG